MPAQLVVIAGPSGSGKSRLCARLGLPCVSLDDFYRDGTDPALPRLASGLVDWDDPGSWLADEAVETLERLCRDGVVDVPVYEISRDGRTGWQRIELAGSPYVVAEGVFAQEVVAACRERGLLALAVCVRNHRLVTFWRRLSRDLREHRKSPMVLVRRGVRLTRDEPRVVAHAVHLGCTAMSSRAAYRTISALPT